MPNWFWPESTSETSVVVRLGRLLHWLGFGLGVLLFAGCLIGGTLTGEFHVLMGGLVSGVFVMLIGRAARYLLSNE